MVTSYASQGKNTLTIRTELSRTQSDLSSVYQRLSSGLRINSPSDDPGGLALSAVLSADSRIANVALRNANDGLSVTAVADTALGEVQSILYRLAELAGNSANGTYTNVQRSAFSSEFVALGSEIDRISKTTTFNGMYLLSNSADITVHVGYDATTNSQITMKSVTGTLRALGLSNSADAATLMYSLNDTTTTYAQAASTAALSAVRNAIDSIGVTRGTIGAAESRLEKAVGLLSVARENFEAAISRIRDADVANDAADLIRLQILQSANGSLLAQANQEPSLLLGLLN